MQKTVNKSSRKSYANRSALHRFRCRALNYIHKKMQKGALKDVGSVGLFHKLLAKLIYIARTDS